jgi:hypothetical protein
MNYFRAREQYVIGNSKTVTAVYVPILTGFKFST